jgi:pentose-5-phosphate-3-epimerase
MTADAGPAPGPTPVPRLSAGVLTADLTRLGAQLDLLRGMASWAHVDVMDGTFCPQLTALAEQREPHVLRGVAISPGTPVQAVDPVLELVDLVLVLAVDPGWPGQAPAASTGRRISAVRELAADLGITVQVCVDGGVTIANAAEVASWGPDVIVSGSAIYDGKDPASNLSRLLEQLHPTPASSPPNPETSVR